MDAAVTPLLIVTLIVMLVGLLGSALPGLPGVPLIFLSALVYAIATGFDVVGWLIIALLGVFAAIALVADFVATTYGARRFGASSWGTTGGAIGGIVGALVGALFLGIGSLFGLILGTVGGIFLGEYLKRRQGGRAGAQGGKPSAQTGSGDWGRVSWAAGGVLIGYVASAIVQGFLGLLSVIIFILALIY